MDKITLKTEIEYNGKKQSLKEWSDEIGVTVNTMRHRITAGFTTEDILFSGDLGTIRRKIERNGKTQSFTKWVAELKIPWRVVKQRKAHGWSAERILSTPHKNTSGRKFGERKVAGKSMKTSQFYADAERISNELRSEGISYKEIAKRLNSMGLRKSNGKEFKWFNVRQILERAGNKNSRFFPSTEGR